MQAVILRDKLVQTNSLEFFLTLKARLLRYSIYVSDPLKKQVHSLLAEKIPPLPSIDFP
jgi:hypothetical protein